MLKRDDYGGGFLSLCYHYIRSEEQIKKFPRIIGFSQNNFLDHVKALNKNFEITSINDISEFLNGSRKFEKNNPGLLFTFDDGLSDHFETARLLSSHNIKGVFFIPTCILDGEPANPTIIHYCIAKYGIEGFIKEFQDVVKKNQYRIEFDLDFNRETENVWEKIDDIKNKFKYFLHYKMARKILLQIYDNTLKNDFSNALEIMHLTEEQIVEMLEMEHSIGTHTHTHISFAHDLTKDDFEKEFVLPKRRLDSTFKISCRAMSYPWAAKKDRIGSEKFLGYNDEYKLIFTTDEKMNLRDTSRFQLGRYQPRISDDSESLCILLSNLQK